MTIKPEDLDPSQKTMQAVPVPVTEPTAAEIQTEQNKAVLEALGGIKELLGKVPAGPAGPVPDQVEAYLAKLEEAALVSGPVATNEEINLETASTTEIVKHILEQVDQKIGPVAGRVETIRIQNEIQKVSAKHSDFFNYKTEIFNIGSANPGLSVEQVYRLAKEQKDGNGGKKEEEEKKDKDPNTATKESKLDEERRKAPSAVPLSEKVGLSSAAVQGTENLSTMGAAEKAFDEMIEEAEGK